MTPETALTELRLSTRAEHDRIEALLRLTEPMRLARYAAIVHGFDAFLRAWEPRVQDALPERLRPWFRTRRRGGFTSADIEWLRTEADEPGVEMDARAAAALPLGDLPQILGSLYVIEGSALGGRVIAPILKKTLGLGAGSGATYFNGFGGQTGVMWRDFRILASLEIGESPTAVARACRSARDTFGALIDLFAPLAPLESPAVPAASPEPTVAAADATPRAFEPPAGAADSRSEDDTILDLR